MSTTRRFQRPKKSTVKFFTPECVAAGTTSIATVWSTGLGKLTETLPFRTKLMTATDTVLFIVFCVGVCGRSHTITVNFFDLHHPSIFSWDPPQMTIDQGVLGTIHLSPCSPSHLYGYY